MKASRARSSFTAQVVAARQARLANQRFMQGAVVSSSEAIPFLPAGCFRPLSLL